LNPSDVRAAALHFIAANRRAAGAMELVLNFLFWTSFMTHTTVVCALNVLKNFQQVKD
jgi:hypothetical protein